MEPVDIDWYIQGVFQIFILCFPSPRRASLGQFLPLILSLPGQKLEILLLVGKVQEEQLIANRFYDTPLPYFKRKNLLMAAGL